MEGINGSVAQADGRIGFLQATGGSRVTGEKVLKLPEHRVPKKASLMPKVINLVGQEAFNNSVSTSMTYTKYGVNVARYAVTQMLKQYPFSDGMAGHKPSPQRHRPPT